MNIALWAIAGIWTLFSFSVLVSLVLVPRLPRMRPVHAPSVAVVVAARDEAGRIEETVARLVAQQGVDLRIVVADDRSADATPDILARFAAQHENLDVERIDELPPDWLGKCHALHRGAQRAGEHNPDWLLFIDADVWLAKDAVARAVSASERSECAHVTLLPTFSHSAGLGRPSVLVGMATFLVRSALCNLRAPGQQVGVGGFNLLRAETYRKIGGHEPLRLEIVDDLYLAVLANRAGARTRVLRAPDACEVEYGVSLRNLLAVTRKNNFAIFRYRTPVAVLSLLLFITIWGGALLGPLHGGPAGWAALGGLVTTIPACAAVAQSIAWNPAPALLAPLAQAALPLMLLNSMIATLREGGVRWRETFYPLCDLRRGRVR